MTKLQDPVIRMKQKFSPSVLSKFLYQTLVFTEEVKNVLKLNRNEAIYSLKPWHMETMVKQELSKSACICSKSESEVEEIAAGISKTLLQTQQLREKLSHGTITREDKQFSVSDIYNPLGTDGKKRGREKNLQASNNKFSAVKHNDTNKLNVQKRSTEKGLQTKTVDENSSTNSEGSRYKQLKVLSGKLQKNKNFLAINKQNVKHTKEIRKHEDINRRVENSKSSSSITKTKYIKYDKRASMASTSELKDLIQKMSNESSNCTSFNKDTKCPLHGNVTSQITYEQNFITMDVVDSLNAFSIPGEIIKSLKAYHAYLNNDISDKVIDNGKRKKTFNKFLIEFDKMDKTVQKSLIQKDHITTTLTKFISLFQNLFCEDIKVSDLTSIKRGFADINSVWNMYNAKELRSLQILKSGIRKTLADSNSYTTGWMSNGIWNPFYVRNFEGLSRVQCVYYVNSNQLLLFFEMMQQLQQTQYSKDLIEIILEDILPKMKMHFDSTKSEFVKMYKVLHVLSQGLNPKVSVLVRTDK